jgi:predicted RNase H-like HicB family nuclease
MSVISHTVYYTTAEDGTFLVASIDTPRFCVGGATEQEAFEKAKRAIEYYDSVKDKFRSIPPRETRVISPFYQEKELCAD